MIEFRDRVVVAVGKVGRPESRGDVWSTPEMRRERGKITA